MRQLFALFVTLIFLFGGPLVFAKDNLPLTPSQAFSLSILYSQPKQLLLQWQIAPGYYLYRERMNIQLASDSAVTLKSIQLPAGQMKQSPLQHNSYQVYVGQIQIPLQLITDHPAILKMTIGYQGCSEEGFCYAPIKKFLTVDFTKKKPLIDLTQTLPTTSKKIHFSILQQQYAEQVFDTHNLVLIVLCFLGLGTLLSFTPCVLPMVPILSGIIIGHKSRQITTRKTFLLSLSYVSGMAIAYAIAGTLVALMGSRIQTLLQQPWVILLFSGLFILLALSLLGFYQLQLPAAWQRYLTRLSQSQKAGTYLGVFLMGGIASLIVSPCVSAPLVGVLSYIAQTGNALLGAIALLALGFGMGLPLLLLGASAGSLLPRTGHWMVIIEQGMGISMLAFAIWLASRVVPGPLTLFLWGTLCLFTAIYLKGFKKPLQKKGALSHSLQALLIVYGTLLMLGAALGNSDPFHPWENWPWCTLSKTNSVQPQAIPLYNMQQLDNLLKTAALAHKPVIVDFYADWCESCVKMERTVFKRPEVIKALSNFVWLRANLTANNAFDQALLHRFNVIAPPTFLFFDSQGKELYLERMVGEQTAEVVLSHLENITLRPINIDHNKKLHDERNV